MTFYLGKNDANVPSKSKKRKADPDSDPRFHL
jgi:hypothetical protein